MIAWTRVSANADPTRINCVPELPTFGVIAGVSPTEVQWESLFLENRLYDHGILCTR
ncbi:hypothetical protein DPMN_045850 [Dreissena polymorpha]|uniref:Uncharacterized protein n=1 Tax=Dreissena polymorpha TaxID=45954 RepID=A0A9D4D8I8_DREPO|nr:hypothetical protein DPMN_045850 [Dreissena polymorpha]